MTPCAARRMRKSCLQHQARVVRGHLPNADREPWGAVRIKGVEHCALARKLWVVETPTNGFVWLIAVRQDGWFRNGGSSSEHRNAPTDCLCARDAGRRSPLVAGQQRPEGVDGSGIRGRATRGVSSGTSICNNTSGQKHATMFTRMDARSDDEALKARVMTQMSPGTSAKNAVRACTE